MERGHSNRTRIRETIATAMLAMLLLDPVGAHAERYRILYTFNGNDGQFPDGTLAIDAAGNLYGTAGRGPKEHGVVFRLKPDGTFDILYAFTGGSDGDEPLAGVTIDRKTGDLFGTTWAGGASNEGVVFKVSATGEETVLHDFSGARDGGNTQAGLIRDGTGNLFGVATWGGAKDRGTIFRIGRDGEFKVLHAFEHAGGTNPYSRLKIDPAGNLYGTTLGGGLHNAGVVFKLASDGTYSVLHHFDPSSGDGQNPVARLARDAAGNIYGGTESGGDSNTGIVFKLAPDGTETILHSFNRDDGFRADGDLRRVRSGALYGTTVLGGKFDGGTAFRLAPDGTERVLHSFGAHDDGQDPFAGLTPAPDHGFYGATEAGGANGLGTIFWVDN